MASKIKLLNIREQAWEIKKGCHGRMMSVRAIRLLNTTTFGSEFIEQYMAGKFEKIK